MAPDAFSRAVGERRGHPRDADAAARQPAPRDRARWLVARINEHSHLDGPGRDKFFQVELEDLLIEAALELGSGFELHEERSDAGSHGD